MSGTDTRQLRVARSPFAFGQWAVVSTDLAHPILTGFGKRLQTKATHKGRVASQEEGAGRMTDLEEFLATEGHGSDPYSAAQGNILIRLIEKAGNSPDEPLLRRVSRAVREHPSVFRTPEIRHFICDALDGRFSPPKGRPRDDGPLFHRQAALMPIYYRRYLDWLRSRERTCGLGGWAAIKGRDWWQGPPNERAARMTCHALRLSMGWRRLQNIISAREMAR